MSLFGSASRLKVHVCGNPKNLSDRGHARAAPGTRPHCGRPECVPARRRRSALEREAEARTHLEALNAIGRVIASSLEITDVFDTFATETQRLLRHDRLSAHVLTADGLVDELFAVARAAGISHVTALAATENRAALALLRRAADVVDVRLEGPELSIRAAIA